MAKLYLIGGRVFAETSDKLSLLNGVILKSNSGATGVTGTGALDSQVATVAGAGIRTITGTGSPASQAATAAGTGARVITGTGALSSQPAAASGAGARVIAGSGDLAAQAATAAGVGTRSITGTGSLSSDVSTVSGAGDVSGNITGTGALTSEVATVAGSGEVGNVISGSGALASEVATVAGTGSREITGSGTPAAQVATVVGSGARVITGTIGLGSVEQFTDPDLLEESSFDFQYANGNWSWSSGALSLSTVATISAWAGTTDVSFPGDRYNNYQATYTIDNWVETGFGNNARASTWNEGDQQTITGNGTYEFDFEDDWPVEGGLWFVGWAGVGSLDFDVTAISIKAYSLSAENASVAGVGTVTANITGTGAFASDAAAVAGTGSVGGVIAGSGALASSEAAVSGTGVRRIIGEPLLGAELNDDADLNNISEWLGTVGKWTATGVLEGTGLTVLNTLYNLPTIPQGLYKVQVTCDLIDNPGFELWRSTDEKVIELEVGVNKAFYYMPSTSYFNLVRYLGTTSHVIVSEFSWKSVVGLVSEPATCSGSGTVTANITGTGALASPVATVAGVGNVDDGLITGNTGTGPPELNPDPDLLNSDAWDVTSAQWVWASGYIRGTRLLGSYRWASLQKEYFDGGIGLEFDVTYTVENFNNNGGTGQGIIESAIEDYTQDITGNGTFTFRMTDDRSLPTSDVLWFGVKGDGVNECTYDITSVSIYGGLFGAQPATIAGAGTVETIITGTGAIASPVATVAGTGSREVTGVGAPAAQAATIAGAGVREITGSGALGFVTTTIPDSAQWDDNIEDPVDAWFYFEPSDQFNFARVASTDTFVVGEDLSTKLEDGKLYFVNITVVGYDGFPNVHIWLGDGVSQAIPSWGSFSFPIVADFSSRGEIRVGDLYNGLYGQLWFENLSITDRPIFATVSGTGNVTKNITGTGSLDSQPSVVDGTGKTGAVVTGIGSMESQPATIAGIGIRKITGAGALTAQEAIIDGTGITLLSTTVYTAIITTEFTLKHDVNDFDAINVNEHTLKVFI